MHESPCIKDTLADEPLISQVPRLSGALFKAFAHARARLRAATNNWFQKAGHKKARLAPGFMLVTFQFVLRHFADFSANLDSPTCRRIIFYIYADLYFYRSDHISVVSAQILSPVFRPL